eukprot:Opistho-2@58061
MANRGSRNIKCSVYVKNLSEKTKSEDLHSIFDEFGKIKDVYLPKDYYSGKLRGFGYVEFFDERDAEDCVKNIKRTMLHGRELEIEFAQGERKSKLPQARQEKGHRRLRAR